MCQSMSMTRDNRASGQSIESNPTFHILFQPSSLSAHSSRKTIPKNMEQIMYMSNKFIELFGYF
jgi:hypothetical protein